MDAMSASAPHSRATQLNIRHDADRSCFECEVDGHRCVIDYHRLGDVLQIVHTGVPTAVEGRGIAAALVRFALDHARANALRIDPVCSYVRVYMQRHAETHDLLAR